MGGVGKTTLVKQVAEQAKQEKLFPTQVYIDVSWTREDAKFEDGISSIQQHIADMLGLELKEATIPARAGKLMERLKKEKILIVLDDIWKEVNLGKVGIPSCNKDDEEDCTIVLASRDEDLLRRDMGAKECFPIQHLEEEEAWELFKKTAGDDSFEGDNRLRPIAGEVVKECQGLPVAIVTIGKALKDETSLAVWKNALEELRGSGPTNIRGVEEKVYGCLEWSYNRLKSDEAKSLFLLCGSMNHGDIRMDELLKYAMGLDSFDRIESLEKAINKLIALVRILKASSLLLDGDGEYQREASCLLFMDGDGDYNKSISSCSVRIHDVVRDVARNIASKHPHHHRFADLGIEGVQLEDGHLLEMAPNESKFISLHCSNASFDVQELPQRLVRPKLQFFLLDSKRSPFLNISIPDTFFEGMKGLKVLDLSGTDFEKLPSTFQSLANLRTLCLDCCKKLRDIAVIGELKKLQILSMVNSKIQQLPQEMAQLTNLRLLDLNHCYQLKVIPPNILSSLSRLECLFMESEFYRLTAEKDSDGESNIAYYLLELNHLDHLRTIQVHIPDVKLVPSEVKFFENLTSYAIFIGDFKFLEKKFQNSKILKLNGVDGSLLSRSGMGKLLEKTEQLELKKLKKVFCGPILVTYLDNLKTLVVNECHGLKSLILLSTARGLPQLEEMTIAYCREMRQIIEYKRVEHEDDHVGINLQLFPKLRSIILRSLSNLISFGYFTFELESPPQGNILHRDIPFFINKVSFSHMEKLELINLPGLKEIWHQQFPLDSFSNLGVLRVEDCPFLLNLIPCHLMGSFKNLKEIVVNNCEALEHVFNLQGYDTDFEILPKLETLNLRGLVGLKGIILCNNEKNDRTRGCFSPFIPLSFHNLKHLSIDKCGKENKHQKNVDIPIEDGVLFGELVSFENLQELKLKNLSMLKMIWHPQGPQLSNECFGKLQILDVCTCSHLVNLIPSHLIESFQNLKKVTVHDCKVLECVFDHGGLNGDNRILPQLEIVDLHRLPRLRLIFCNEDKNDNMRYILSHFKFKDFHHLKELRIINCEMLLDEKVWLSPNLEVLILENLSHLKEIDFGTSPKLKFLRLKKLPEFSNIICNKVTNKRCTHFSRSTFKNFYNLKELQIDDAGMKDGNRRDVYIPAISNGLQSNKKLCFLEAFESRTPAWNKIIDALRDDKMKMIGVCGMGGVGKTTLVKRAAQQAKEEKLFTIQVYVDASFWDTIRAADLKRTLKKAKENILIIIDGIGEEIDLEEIGIPCRKDDDDDDDEDLLWKVVLISRDREVLISKGMGFGPHEQICIQLETLPAEEAWNLFEKTCTASSSSSSSSIGHGGYSDCENWNINISEEVRSIANKVVEECCKGVPLGIVTIAKALKDHHEMDVWKNALEHMMLTMMSSSSSSTTTIAFESMGKKVYSFLESIFSMTHFKGHDHGLKSFLLLCAFLVSTSGYVSMDRLLQYAVGLDLFHPTDSSLDQATNKLLSLSTCLLEATAPSFHTEIYPSLLFRDVDNKFVQMHNVFYDVATEIASNDLTTFVVFNQEDVLLEEWSQTDEAKRCTFISLQYSKPMLNQLRLPQQLLCPELQLFILHNKCNSLNIPNTFFQGMKKLQVLDLLHMKFKTLPSSLGSLANLRTLRLDGCSNLEDIALIEKLTKLEVLSLTGSGIRQLPIEMSQLTNLRLLDMNMYRRLAVIPPNVLSSLSRLECLFMRYNFTTQGAVQDDQSNIACISELNHLSNLKRYSILQGAFWNVRTDRTMELNKLNRSLHIGEGINKLLDRSKELVFSKLSGTEFVLRPSNRESFLELKHLQVCDSPEIRYIIDSILDQQYFLQQSAFPLLESLSLEKLKNLEQVWHGSPIPLRSFGNLKTLVVSSCPKLRYLLSLSMARGLSQLESMTIKDCKAMQQIIAYDERESEEEYDETRRTNLEPVPNLRTLKLQQLPELINFIFELKASSTSSTTYKVSFSKLEMLQLHEVPKWKDICYPQPSSESSNLRRILHVCENAHNCSYLNPHAYHEKEGFPILRERWYS